MRAATNVKEIEMNRIFAITTANKTSRLDNEGKGEAAFTITNSSTRPIRGLFKVKTFDSTKAEWLSIGGEIERDFAPNATDKVAVGISVPAGTAPGTYSFRLDVFSVVNREDEYTEGPTVAIEVEATVKKEIKFPWWILIVAIAVLVIGGVGAWVLLRPKMVDVPNVLTKTITEAESVAAERGFNVVVDRKEDRNASDERVIAQDPSEGQAKKGSDLKLTVTMPVPPLKLDNYIGKKINDVRPLLESKYRIVNVQNKETDSEQQGNILGQQPGEGTILKVGESVTFTIAVPLTPFPMPQVANVGKSVSTAKSELEGKGLKVSINDQVNPSVPHEQVIEQYPPANAMVKSGDAVQLKYAITLVQVPAFPQPVPMRMPIGKVQWVGGVPWQTASQTLNNVGFYLAEVRGDCTFAVRTNPPAGTAAPKGMGVTIYTLGDANRVCHRPLRIQAVTFSVYSRYLRKN
jgi:beta-lactam-binding protein with PASTA domain